VNRSAAKGLTHTGALLALCTVFSLIGCGNSRDESTCEIHAKVLNGDNASYGGVLRAVRIPIQGHDGEYRTIFIEIRRKIELSSGVYSAYLSGFANYYSNVSGYPTFIGKNPAEEEEMKKYYAIGLSDAKACFGEIGKFFDAASK
jgi:hypothetical protein